VVPAQGFPGLLVRFGLLEKLEARLTMSGWSFEDAATGDESGFNDMGLGAKWAIASENGAWPQSSLLAEVNLPVGDPGAGLVVDVPTWLVGAGVGFRLFH
jgi:hypothetical protein